MLSSAQHRLLSEALRVSMAERHNWPLRLAALPRSEAMEALRICTSQGWRSTCLETDTYGLRTPPVALEAAQLAEERALLIFGAEDVGLDAEVLAACDECVSIRTVARGSLNVSHAVALVLHERLRQQRLAIAMDTGNASAPASRGDETAT